MSTTTATAIVTTRRADTDMNEGDYFVRRRFGKQTFPYGVYQRIGGQDIRVTAFKTKEQAAMWVAVRAMSRSEAPINYQC